MSDKNSEQMKCITIFQEDVWTVIFFKLTTIDKHWREKFCNSCDFNLMNQICAFKKLIGFTFKIQVFYNDESFPLF